MAKKVINTPEGSFVEGSPEYNAIVKSDAQYRIDFYKAKVAANPSWYPAVDDLADAYADAAKTGLFSASETKTFNDLSKQYADQVPDLKASYKAQQALTSAGSDARRTIYDQAVEYRDNLFNEAVAERDKIRQDATDYLDMAMDEIAKGVSNGTLNVNQAEALRTQARENYATARSTADANFDIKYAAATKAFNEGKTYADQVQAGIASGQLDPSGSYAAQAPQYSGLAAIPTFNALNYDAVQNIAAPVYEPRTGPIQRVEPEKITVDKPQIGDIVGDALREMEAAEAEIAKPIAYPSTSAVTQFTEDTGITDKQARDIANQLVVAGYYNVDIDDLTNFIKANGVEAAIERIESTPGAELIQQKDFIPYDLAKDAVEFMYSQYGIEQDPQKNAGGMQYKPNWIEYAQRNGIEATAELFAERQPAQKGSPAQGGDYSLLSATTAKFTPEVKQDYLQTYYETERSSLDDTIDRILGGESVTPSLNFSGTSEDLVRQLAQQAGGTYNPDDPYSQYLINFADKYGPEATVAEFNRESRAAFNKGDVGLVSGSGFRASDIYGEQPVASGQGTAPTVNSQNIYGSQPTYTPTTYQPRAGLPAALPEARSLITETERPQLSPELQFIGAPSVDRGFGYPMQPFIPSQFGLETLTPAQYAEAARAAAIQEAGGVPVEPFSTPIASGEGMKEGGLASVAKTLESKGRGEDSMLIHMSPNEIAGLQAAAESMGGTLTINPETGLPEADIFNRIGKGFKKLAKNPIVRTAVAALAAPYLPPIFGSTAITAGLLTGAGTMIGGGNFQQGVQSGLMAWGGAKALGATGYGQPGGYSLPGLPQPTAMNPSIGAEFGGIGASPDDIAGFTPSPVQEQLANIPAGGSAASQMAANNATGSTILGMKPETALILGTVGSGLYEGKQERDMFEKQYDDYLADVAARKRRGLESFERSSMPTLVASGGLISLAKGGITYAEGGGTTGPSNEPRMVKGNGDGMSDSIPATIEGVQEARLANDEFVIPADVVADIGNGSSSAGAKQLYAMMDRVREARHGTTEQPPEINAMKLMPA